MAPTIELFDDPLNPRGWVLEPVRRRIGLAYPDADWRVRAVGMVETWDDYDGPEVEGGRAGMAAACARMSERHGMPIDEYLWFDDPPESSWPACRAIAGAGLQGDELAGRLLRACREATFLRRRRVDDDDALRAVIEGVPGLDAGALAEALEDGRAGEAFEADREAAASLDVPGIERAGDRPELPTLVAREGGDARGVSGLADEAVLLGAVADVTGRDPPTVEPGVGEVVERFSPEGWVTAAELGRLTGLEGATVAEEARALVEEGSVVEETFAAEPCWRLAEFGDGAR